MVTLLSHGLNEAVAPDGLPTATYDPLLATAEGMGPEELARRWVKAKHLAAADSFTFRSDPTQRSTVPTDWLPRVIPMNHWRKIEMGIKQRLAALNLFLYDLYCGKQDIVPDDVVYSGRYFRPDLQGVRPPRDTFVHIYGIDLVHLGDGEYAVLEDNLRVPSGIAYELKSRQIGAQCFPEFRDGYSVLPYDIAPAYHDLFASLCDYERPNVVLLSDGKGGSAYFEHRYLSDHLGIPLVEGSDLYVDSSRHVWCRTIDGDFHVDVIYRRVEDLEMFVPKLTEAYKAGNVALVNALGTGAADDKLVFLWVPEMVRSYLGEEAVLQQAKSYYFRSYEDYENVKQGIDRMVLKTRDGYGGLGVYIMPDLSPELREDAARAVREQPNAFIAQEMLDFSRHLVFDESLREFDERFIDLRVYAVQDGNGKITVFPGGLTRVARSNSRVTNNSSGGACKETWVVS